VIPLCPSQTKGNVGHKHRSQATQLGKNLSHKGAYNGEEKVYVRKGHICGELDAWKMIMSFCKRSPQVLWACTFKGVYLISVRSSRTRAIKLKKNLKREKMEKREKENEQ